MLDHRGKLLLGIDIGTTGTKCSVYDLRGNIKASAYQEYPMIHPIEGWTEQNPHRWWSAVQKNMKNIFQKQDVNSADILSIGLSCTNAVVLVDNQGEPIYNAIGHQDRRAARQAAWLKERMDERQVEEISGNRIANGSFFLPSVRWLFDHRPKAVSKAYKILMPSGYIIQKLTGMYSINRPRASFSLLYNVKTGDWENKFVEQAQIPYEILPKIYDPYEIVGHVTEKAAQQTGLTVGTPVTAGCLDSVSSALAAGAVDQGDIALTVGSSARICCIDDHPALDHRILTSCSPYKGLFTIIQSTDNAGVSLRWFRDVFGKAIEPDAEKSGCSIYAYMDRLAEKIPAGSDGLIYLPYLNGEKSPIWDPKARGVFFGMSLATDYGCFVRSIMEGVAYSIKDCLEQMPYQVSKDKAIPIGGGSSQSCVWCQIFADVLNRPIIQLLTGETETLGDIIIAAQSIGIKGIDRYFGKKLAEKGNIIYPNKKNIGIYKEGFKRYKNLYLSLKGLF